MGIEHDRSPILLTEKGSNGLDCGTHFKKVGRGAATARDGMKLSSQGLARWGWAERGTVVVILSAADYDRMALQSDFFSTYGERREEAKAASVEELANEAGRWSEVAEGGTRVASRENGGEVLGSVGAFEVFKAWTLSIKDARAEEDRRAEGLVLRRGGRASVTGKVIQEAGHVVGGGLAWMLTGLRRNELSAPINVRFRGPGRRVNSLERSAHGFDESHRRNPGRMSGEACVVRRGRMRMYRSQAEASRVERSIFRSRRAWGRLRAIGTSLESRERGMQLRTGRRGDVSFCGGIAGGRGNPAAGERRPWRDRSRIAAIYLREYGDKAASGAVYPRDYLDTSRRAEVYRQNGGVRPHATSQRDVRPEKGGFP